MGIDLSQWRAQIGLYYKYVGRTRAHRGDCKAGAASSSARCSPMLALTMVFCLITAPSLLLQAGDVERNPGPGTLGVKDLSRVWGELRAVENRWVDIGLELKLSVETLRSVRGQSPDPSTSLHEMLFHWLKKVDQPAPPTWEELACALESRSVREGWLAEELREKYCRTGPHPGWEGGFVRMFHSMLSPRRRQPYYYALLYRICQQNPADWGLHFVITRDLDTEITAIKKMLEEEHSDALVTVEDQFPVEFQDDVITLSIPKEGVEIDGWKISCRHHPSITKVEVDNFRYSSGRALGCLFYIHLMDLQQPAFFEYKVTLNGAKPPGDYFTIIYPPLQAAVPVQSSERRLSPFFRFEDFPGTGAHVRPFSVNMGLGQDHQTEGSGPIPVEESSALMPRARVISGSDAGITELIPKVDASVLTENDLADVFNAVEPLSRRWREMFSALKLHLWLEETIAAFRDDPRCLKGVVKHWLRRHYDTQEHDPPTWQMLVVAAEKSSGGNNPDLARQIAESHLENTPLLESVEEEISPQLQHPEDLVTDPLLPQQPLLPVVSMDCEVHSKAIPSPEGVFRVRNELKIDFREVAGYLYNRNLITSKTEFHDLCRTKLTPEQKWQKLLFFLHTNPDKMEDFLDSLERREREYLTEMSKDPTRQTSADQKEFAEFLSTPLPSPSDEPGELGDERLSELPYQEFLSQFKTLFTDGFKVKDNIIHAILNAKSLAQDDTIVGVALGYDLDTRWKEQRPCLRVLMQASTRQDDSAAEMQDLKKKVSEEVTKCMNKSEKRKYSAKDSESWLKFSYHDPKKYKCTKLYSGEENHATIPGITIAPDLQTSGNCCGGTMGLMVEVKLQYYIKTDDTWHKVTNRFGLACAHTVLDHICDSKSKPSDSEWGQCEKWKEWKKIKKSIKDWRQNQSHSPPSTPIQEDGTPKTHIENDLFRIVPTLFPRQLNEELGEIKWGRHTTSTVVKTTFRCCSAVCGWFSGDPFEVSLYSNDDQKARFDIAAFSLECALNRYSPEIEGIDEWKLADNFTELFPQSGGAKEKPVVYTYNIRDDKESVPNERKASLYDAAQCLTKLDSDPEQHMYNLIFCNESEKKFVERGDSGSIVYSKVLSGHPQKTVACVFGMIYGGNADESLVFAFPLDKGIECLSSELYYAAAEKFLKSRDEAEYPFKSSLENYIQDWQKKFFHTKTGEPIAMKFMPKFHPPEEFFKFSISPCLGPYAPDPSCPTMHPGTTNSLPMTEPEATQDSSMSTEAGSLETAVHIPTPEEIHRVRFKLTIDFRKVADYWHNKKLISQKQFDSLIGNTLTPEKKWLKIVNLLQSSVRMKDFLDSLEDGDWRNLIKMIEDTTRQTTSSSNTSSLDGSGCADFSDSSDSFGTQAPRSPKVYAPVDEINSLVENMNDLHLEESRPTQQSSLPASFNLRGGSQMENNTQDSSMSLKGKITPSQYEPPEPEDCSTFGSINNHHEH